MEYSKHFADRNLIEFTEIPLKFLEGINFRRKKITDFRNLMNIRKNSQVEFKSNLRKFHRNYASNFCLNAANFLSEIQF